MARDLFANMASSSLVKCLLLPGDILEAREEAEKATRRAWRRMSLFVAA
jgi:hypothetical protein